MKRVLITALGMNDPIHRGQFHTSASATQKDREFLRHELVDALSNPEVYRKARYVLGPLASGLVWWKTPQPLSEDIQVLFPHRAEPWAPTELLVVYSDDSDLEELRSSPEISLRLDLCRRFLPRLTGIAELKVTGIPLKMEPYSYEMCWFHIERQLRPLLQPGWRPAGTLSGEFQLSAEEPEPVDYRILVGPATQAIRTALFLLGISAGDPSQLWYLVDAAAMQHRYGREFPVVAPFRFGSSGLPHLIERSRFEAATSQLTALQDAQALSLETDTFDFKQMEEAMYRRILTQLLKEDAFQHELGKGKMNAYEAFAKRCAEHRMPRQTLHSVRDLFHPKTGCLKLPTGL